MLLEGKRIVYIEDDPKNRMVVELIVKSEGGRIWFERWGVPSAAITTVIGFMPLDLILLDLMFPKGYSGYEIFHALRQWHDLKDVPIVMISAADAELEMPRARQLGFDGYIAKPIDADQLAHQLKTVMDGKAIWHDGSSIG